MISPGSTSSPVSSRVSRIAPSWTVSSTSRKPPGCAHAPRRLDPAPDQDDLTGLGQRHGRRDEPRVDVGDVAAARTGQPLPMLALERPVDELGPAARAMVERRRDPGRDPFARGDVGRAAVRPAAASRPSCREDRQVTTARTPSSTTWPRTRPAGTAPRPGLTGIHAQAERQIRSAASAGGQEQQRRPDEHAQLDQRAPERHAELERRDRDRAADEGDDRQRDVVALERRRPELRHRPRREALEARRKARLADRLAVERRACPGSYLGSSIVPS